MEEERMPKVNVNKDSIRLTTSDLHYMKEIEAENIRRVSRLKKLQFRTRLIGGLLTGFVISIYSYTIFAVKQEKFLDDFDEPEKISDVQ